MEKKKQKKQRLADFKIFSSKPVWTKSKKKKKINNILSIHCYLQNKSNVSKVQHHIGDALDYRPQFVFIGKINAIKCDLQCRFINRDSLTSEKKYHF